jgi:hypothetical protein
MTRADVIRRLRDTATPALGPPAVAAIATLIALSSGSSVLESVAVAALVNLVSSSARCPSWASAPTPRPW